MTVATHKTHAPTDVGCLMLTVSDTRTERGDTSGRAIRDLLVEHGHTVTGAAIVSDDPERVATTIRDHLADPATRIVIATGGTSITSRDRTRASRNPARGGCWFRLTVPVSPRQPLGCAIEWLDLQC